MSSLNPPVMAERMLYSYYVIKTRLVILLFVLAIILSAHNIFPALVLVTCMSYFNLIINLFLRPATALNSALCFCVSRHRSDTPSTMYILSEILYKIQKLHSFSLEINCKLTNTQKRKILFHDPPDPLFSIEAPEVQHGAKTRLSQPVFLLPPPSRSSVPPPW